jgi:hydroxyacylglutathione hydrolase
LKLGSIEFEVRHTPGHTPGLCVFYVADIGAERSDPIGERSRSVCFCGDLIFRDSVGRTDLPGGDWQTLLDSIHTQIFTLPDETRLLSGHGPETTVGEEKRSNPYLMG